MWARDQERIYQGSDQSYHSEEVGTLKTRSVNKPKGVLYGLQQRGEQAVERDRTGGQDHPKGPCRVLEQ